MPTSLICNVPIQYGEIYAGGRAGALQVDGAPVTGAIIPYCSSGWIEVAQVIPFDSSQIDPTVVTALIGAGFLLYLTPWAAAYGFSSLLKMLR